MINNSEFSKRLKKVLEYYQLSASAFAEKINVQRSSISHLLSGRNKPSLDFVLKVLHEFKEVELYWLLKGKGSFPKKEKTAHHSTSLFDESEITLQKKESDNLLTENKQDVIPTTSSKTIEKKYIPQESNQTKVPSNLKITNNNSNIDRIVIFFKDGSFKNYTDF